MPFSTCSNTGLTSLLLGLAVLLTAESTSAQTPMVGFANTELVKGKAFENQGKLTVGVKLSQPATKSVTVQYSTQDLSAKAPGDYIGTTGTVVFAIGEIYKSFDIILVNDSVPEPVEYGIVKLSNPVNATLDPNNSSGEFTIYDDDGPPPTLQFSASNYTVKENAGSATITVQMSGPWSTPVTVKYATLDGTAIAKLDYLTASGTLTFNPWETSQTFTVTIIDDSISEPDEILSLTLSNPTSATLGSPNVASLTIIDDDLPQPTVIIEIEGPGPEDDFVFLTPSDADQKLTAAVYVRVAAPIDADLPVTISNESGGGDFLFSIDGNSWASSISLLLPKNGDSLSIMLAGDSASTNMNDAVILVEGGGKAVGEKKGTVPMVKISFRNKSTETAEGEVDKKDNAAQDNYKELTVPKSYQLGPVQTTTGYNWAVLTIGTVTPADFAGKPIVLERSAQGRMYVKAPAATYAEWDLFDNNDFPSDPYSLPANDTTPDPKFTDLDPQSGGSKGRIYDIDAPGFQTKRYAGLTKGWILSFRQNFAVFASFKNKRVSEKHRWYCRQSYKKTDDVELTWEPEKSIEGDNTSKAGTFKDAEWTLLSYALGSPKLDSPDELSKATPDAKIKITGTHLVFGPSVKLTKGKNSAKVTISEFGYEKKAEGTVEGLKDLEVGEWTLEWTNPGDASIAKRAINIKE